MQSQRLAALRRSSDEGHRSTADGAPFVSEGGAMEAEALQQENVRLRAELARTLARAERAESTLAHISEAHVTLARHAAGVTLRRDGVTLVKGEERKRELSALHQANRRIRLHAVTVTPQSD